MSSNDFNKKNKVNSYHSTNQLYKEPSILYQNSVSDHNSGLILVKLVSSEGRVIREPDTQREYSSTANLKKNSGLPYFEYSKFQHSESISDLNEGEGLKGDQETSDPTSTKKGEGFWNCLRPRLDYAATRYEYVKQSNDALSRLKELNFAMKNAISHLKSPCDTESTLELFTLRYHQNLPSEKKSIFGIAIWFITLAVYTGKELKGREVRKNNSRYIKLIDQLIPMVNQVLSIKKKLKYMNKMTEKYLSQKRTILKDFSDCYDEAEGDVDYYRGAINENEADVKEEVKSVSSNTGVVRAIDSIEIFNRISREGSIWMNFTQLELRDKRFYLKLFIRDAYKQFDRFNHEQLKTLDKKLTFNVHNGLCDGILGVSTLGISYLESMKNMNKYLKKSGNMLKQGLGPNKKTSFNYLETEIIFNRIKDIQSELFFLNKRFHLLEERIFHILCSAKVGYSFFNKDSILNKVSIKKWRLGRLILKFREFNNTLEVETLTPEANFTSSPFVHLIMKYPLEFEGQIFTIVFKEKADEKHSMANFDGPLHITMKKTLDVSKA